MNEVIKTLTSHRSYRAYREDKPVSDSDLDLIVQAAQRAASWANGQHVSIVAIKDATKRRKLMELCGNQQHISQAPVFLAFCADFYRVKLACEMEGQPFRVMDTVEALMIGTVDVGIALANAIAAAESLGLGTVPIGGIRRNAPEIVKLLQLPEYVIPVTGLCIGYPAEERDQAFRLPKEMVYFEEQYDADRLNKPEYRNVMNTPDRGASWAQRMAMYYGTPRYLTTAAMLKQQGYRCLDMQDRD